MTITIISSNTRVEDRFLSCFQSINTVVTKNYIALKTFKSCERQHIKIDLSQSGCWIATVLIEICCNLGNPQLRALQSCNSLKQIFDVVSINELKI